MSKAIKITVIIASILVGIGILFMGLSMAMGGAGVLFKSGKNTDVKYVTATFDEVDVVNIKDVSNDVKIIKSENNQVKVTYATTKNYTYFVDAFEGTLHVEVDDLRHWYEYIFNFNIRNIDLIVELPEKTYQEINVKTTSGDIKADNLSSLFTNVETTSGHLELGGDLGVFTASVTSGKINLKENTKAESAIVSTTSGSISITGNFESDLNVSTTSGRINIKDVNSGNATLKANSGDISAENVKALRLDAKTTSGSFTLNDVICEEEMNLNATSGKLDLDKVDASNYNLKSTSGSIKAKILSPKNYSGHATSGKVTLPEADANAEGILRAETTSGNVTIELAN